ncbi:hypothetical protein [Moheibacter sp.]|uniref:hypothetical protein n=1 Tax=Moheibacter sp. TaxID=1965316 RepID=UPI003C70ACAF
MTKIKSHIKSFRNFGLMWFVLFALSPCTVKDAFFSSINSEYAKPLNKSRTTAPTTSCSYAQVKSLQSSVVKESKNKRTEPEALIGCDYLTFNTAINHSDYSNKSSGNSPPKYILYKRLKIAMA